MQRLLIMTYSSSDREYDEPSNKKHVVWVLPAPDGKKEALLTNFSQVAGTFPLEVILDALHAMADYS